MSRQYLRSFGVPAAVLATLYVACADPPKKHNGGAGTGGAIGEAGTSDNGGSDATSGNGGTSGAPVSPEAGMGGEGGVPEAAGGEGGTETGDGGAPPVDPCATATIAATVGAPSKMPPAPATGVAKPAGSAGNLKVINWAGFKGAISYTFDDALPSQRAHYAELNAVGIPMTFYLVCSNDGSNAAWTKAAVDGHELGNHTMHHCDSTGSNCGWGSFTNIDSEIDDCTAHIKSAFGVPDVYTFAAPNGNAGWADPAGKRFLLDRGVYDNPAGVAPNDATNAYNLPCHIAAMGETATMANGYNSISDSVRTKGIWRIILSHSLEMDGTYNPVLASEVVAAMTYTKSLTDVWADTMVAVGSYWRGQKALSTVQPTTVGADKVYSWTLPEHFPPGHYLRATVSGGKVKQCGTELAWDDHGYYEISLDAGSVTISP